MKIRSQINVLLVIATLIILVIAGKTLLLARDVQLATRDIKAAEDLIHSATQLSLVAVQTALFREARSQEQWSLMMASVSEEIERMRTTTPRQEANLDQLRKKLALMQTNYLRLTDTAGLITTAGQTRTVSSLLVVIQETIDIGYELIRISREEANAAMSAMQLAIGLLTLAMVIFRVFMWQFVSRRILRPLRIFDQGAMQLAQGNYSHRIELPQHDEFGDLARTFNAMTARVESSAMRLERRGDRLADAVQARTSELSHAKEVAEALSNYARSLIEANLDPLVTISAQGTITDVNEASVRATGVPRAKLIGTDFSNYFTEPDKARTGYKKAFTQGLLRDYPLAIRHTAGSIMEVLYHAAVYRDDQGNVLGVLASARDITERKHLDQRLQDKNAELEQVTALAQRANLAKSEFLASMSHELRTPLNAILGFAQLIESGSPAPTPTQKRSVGQVLRAGWYLLELIDEILDLAQIDSGKVMMSLEPVALAEVMNDCLTMVGPQAEKCAIAMAVAPLESGYVIQADRTRTKQVLINLLSNAIKYNRPEGTVVVACTMTAPDSIRISIRDTGMGMTPDQMAQLFQPFNRLGRESGPVEGSGIGLVVTKRLIELMGGAIGVSSDVGVGSVFWLEFKLATASQMDGQETMPTGLNRPPVSDATPKRTLLYVEDNPANLELVEQLIARRPDLCMLSAADGLLGIEFARTHQPDLILMDIDLPGIDGLEALKILRADPLTAHIPIIAVSANAMPHDVEMCRVAGFFDYLTKPLKLDALMRTIDLATPLAVSANLPVLGDAADS